MRHGEKDSAGNLTKRWGFVSREIGKSLLWNWQEKHVIATSSAVWRVRQTVENALIWMKKKDTEIYIRPYLGMPGFSDLFHQKWNDELKKWTPQKQMEIDFLTWKWDIKPHEIAHTWFKKLLDITRKEHKNLHIISGTHSTYAESLLLTIFGDEAPETWKTWLEFNEVVYFSVWDNGDIEIRHRGFSKTITRENLKKRYLEVYHKEKI